MATEIREPKQKRSIETKRKIIDASYALFSEVGYYNTNTAEIAKRAGVSTGIVYGYFKDKRDILLEVLELYTDNAYRPILELFDKFSAPDFDVLVPEILESAIAVHKKYAKIHEALHSMTHVDEEVNAKFIALEDTITIKFSSRLNVLGYDCDGLLEKIHLSMNLVQSFAHEYIYDKHTYIDYDKMYRFVCESIINLFK